MYNIYNEAQVVYVNQPFIVCMIGGWIDAQPFSTYLTLSGSYTNLTLLCTINHSCHIRSSIWYASPRNIQSIHFHHKHKSYIDHSSSLHVSFIFIIRGKRMLRFFHEVRKSNKGSFHTPTYHMLAYASLISR